MSYGNWTLECADGFTAAELAEVLASVSEDIELRYIGALGRAQAGFVDAAKEDAGWVHLTLWDPTATGMVLTFERDRADAEPPFIVKVETDIAKERFGSDAARRATVGELARRCVDAACAKLGMKIVGFDAKND